MRSLELNRLYELLEKAQGKLYNSDFLLTWEYDMDIIRATMELARALRELHRNGHDLRTFNSGLAVSIFRDNSTRTRFSYASASQMLGLNVSDMDETKSQIAHGETVRETAAMISFLTEIIGIRDDMYLGYGHSYMKEVAESLDESYEKGVLHQRPGIINLQCDLDHPTQSLSDLSHLVTTFGGVENLRGKKIAMTWAYSPSYGKPLSVAQGITGLMTRFGMDVTLAYPEGYDLLPEVTDMAARQASESGGSLKISHDMKDAFRDADIVYPKSWAPMTVMKRRTELLKGGDSAGLKELEKKALENNAKFTNWEADSEKMALTKDGKGLYMHCLPADITGVSCPKGEVTGEVFENYRLKTYEEASYKPFVISAMAMMTRIENLVDEIKRMSSPECKRRR
ncbi:MAG: knotted carbamoyltransferase YgeW [Deltaproteobacteria bacterium]|nr:knotted carbamoyltransferase YgeW [Deltaproteobacteria bacterium]